MDRKPKTKSQLLEQLAKRVSKWPGTAPVSRRMGKRLNRLMERLGDCRRLPEEEGRYRACQLWLQRARWQPPASHVREAWLVEIWCWQHLLGIGAVEDCAPIPSPRWRREPPVISHDPTLQPPRHYQSMYPLDPGPKVGY